MNFDSQTRRKKRFGSFKKFPSRETIWLECNERAKNMKRERKCWQRSVEKLNVVIFLRFHSISCADFHACLVNLLFVFNVK